MQNKNQERVTLYNGYPGANGAVSVPSATGKTMYKAWFEGDKGYCQCKHAKLQGEVMKGRDKWCRHVLSINADALRGEVEVLKAKLVDDCVETGTWGSFDAVVRGVLEYRKRDANLVATAFLLTAYSQGEACADDVHPLVGDQIEGDTRIIGTVLGSLLRKGVIKKAGSKPSSRKATNHGREIKQYRLTKAGRQVLAGIVFERLQASKGIGA